MDNGEWGEIEVKSDSEEFVLVNDDPNLIDPLNLPPTNHPLTTPHEEEEEDSEDIDGDEYFKEPSDPQPLRWRACIKMLGFGIVEVAYKVRFYAVSAAGLWPIAAAAAGFFVLVVWYGKGKPWRRRRRRPENLEVNWMLVSREKDQKIRQLLLRIAQMNEILSASQRVSVHRVG